MSAAEMLHRVRRVIRGRMEGLSLLVVRRPPEPGSSIRSWTILADVWRVEKNDYIVAADRLASGEVAVFSLSLQGRELLDWNRDPLTGLTGPPEFGKNIDYRDQAIVGNIKYLWEPNRHLELVTFAQAYALTGNDWYLEAVRARLGSWLEQCPYPLGVNWSSSLELGIRLINWSLVWQLIGQRDSALFSGKQGESLLKRWLDSIYQHVHFIRNYYSRFSSANNHLMGEAAGVFIATCAWPFWTEFHRWGAEARQILLEESERQTHSDGVNREQAISYQQFVLDFLVLAGLAGRASGQEFPASYWRVVEKMLEYLQSAMDVSGNVPMIGDADDGYVVRLSQEAGFCPYRSLLATGAVLFDRPDFAASAGRLDDKTRLLVGGDRWPELERRAGEVLHTPRRQFPEGGYYILGTELGAEREIRMVADAGPLGFLSIAAHGHADALAFVLSVAGREILVDPGTYSYHTEPLWRQYFRGTAAHNTVRIDGEDQSVQGGNFMWLRHARARCLEFGYDESGSWFSGQHDGYSRLPDPVIHRRDIKQRGNMIDVTDRVECRAYHLLERGWHFSEHCRVAVQGSVVTAENGPVRVTLRAKEPVTEVRHLRGSEDPPGGWVSRSFDVKVPSDTVYFLNEIRGTTQVETLIEIDIVDRAR